MNDVDFPVQKVLDGIAASEAVGLSPIKVNMSCGAAQRGERPADGAPLPGDGHILRFIEYMDVAHRTAGGSTMSFRHARSSRRSTRSTRLSPSCGVSRRGRRPLPLPRRIGRDRRDLVGDRAFLRRLHARAPLGRRQAVHVPVRDRGSRPARAAPERKSDDEIRAALEAVWTAREDRYSELRSADTAGLKKIEMSFIGG